MNINLSRKELAINGGPPLRTKPWLNNVTTGHEEKSAVMEVLDSGNFSLFEGSHNPDPPFSFTGGGQVKRLEEEWCAFYGSEYAVSVNSATSGLYASVGALGLGFGDEVIVSPFTMTACAMAPMIYGAIPVFADVDSRTGCLDPSSIAACVTKRTRAILVVHQFGFAADMDSIMSIAAQHGLKVIEDCAQAHGAMYRGRYVGTIGHIGVFSLNVNKTIQCGEGGICVTNIRDIAYRIQLIRNHGEAVVGPASYQNILNIAGFNYRMTEICAAIARIQLRKLPSLNTIRLELVEQFKQGIARYDFIKPLEGLKTCDNCNCSENARCKPTYYVFPLAFQSSAAPRLTREAFVSAMNAEGMLYYQGYSKPIYLQPIYQQRYLFKHGYPFTAIENEECVQDYSLGRCPVAERLYFKDIIINEHIRPPHTPKDVNDLLLAIEKITTN